MTPTASETYGARAGTGAGYESQDSYEPQDPYENNPSGDLLRGVDIPRICETVQADRRALEPFAQNRKEAVEQLAGSYYGDGGTPYEVPLPLISTFISIHSRALVAKEPRVSLVCTDDRLAPAVDAMENWLNEWFEEIEFGDMLRDVVTDALISEGHLKVCLTSPEVAELGYGLTPGQVGMYVIDEDDWVCDMRARSCREWSYCGHRYRVPLEVAHDIWRKDLPPTEPSDYDERGNPKIFTISSGTRNRTEIEDYVDLWEIHLRRKGVILTLLDDNGFPGSTRKHILRVQRYVGPLSGNNITLGYGKVPGNLRALSPVMGLLPLHLAANRNQRKLNKTADNFKAILPVRGGSTGSDGKAWKQSKHMEIINADNPQDVAEKRFNIPPPELQMHGQELRSLFDYMGGGLATLGGRAPMSNTVGQEKILNQNASAGLSDMQATTVAFVGRAIAVADWYLWNHPTNVYESVKKVPGQDNDFISRRLFPYNTESYAHQELVKNQALMRQGPMPRIRVDPFSMSHLAPMERRQFIGSIMAELAPWAQFMMTQGVVLDAAELLKIYSKLSDEPALNKVFKYNSPPDTPPAEGGMEEGEGDPALNKSTSGKPAETNRTYTRISQGAGQAGADRSNAFAQMAAANR